MSALRRIFGDRGPRAGTPAPGGPARRAALVLARAGAVTVALLAAAVLAGRAPVFELVTHFRPQYAVAGVACAAALAALRSWRAAALAACAAAFHCAALVPYLPVGGWGEAAGPESPLRVMLVNIQYSNTDAAAVLRAVAEEAPDVLVLEELNGARWADLGGLTASYPHGVIEPRPGASGVALLSRWPLERAEVLKLTGPWMPGVLARVRVGESAVTVVAAHPWKPTRARYLALRNEQFEKLAGLLRATEGPRVLVGDFNCAPWSPYFGDLVRDSGLRDARAGRGLYATWPTFLPPGLRVPLDGCLASDDVRVRAVATRCDTGSDHCALVVDLLVPAAGR